MKALVAQGAHQALHDTVARPLSDEQLLGLDSEIERLALDVVRPVANSPVGQKALRRAMSAAKPPTVCRAARRIGTSTREATADHGHVMPDVVADDVVTGEAAPAGCLVARKLSAACCVSLLIRLSF